jgi:putative Mg2+ transporter-C (MgtC) family protein
MSDADIALRLLAAALSGALLGLNRDLHDKPAGVRTMGIVSVAACAMSLAVLLPTPGEGDLSRVIQGLVTGIGFVGAGIILHTPGERQVHGLTTAASTWFAVASGILSAAGLWWVLLVAGLLCLILLLFGHEVEAWMRQRIYGDRQGSESASQAGDTRPTRRSGPVDDD